MSYFLKKFFYFIFICFFVVSTVFFALRLAPGDPVEKILGPNANFEQRQELRQQLGLDLTMSKQYLNYLGDVIQFSLGDSLFKRKEVIDLVSERIGPTGTIAIVVMVVSLFLGTLIGFVSGMNKSNRIDNSLRLISVVFLAFPIFSLGPLLVIVFAIKFQIFPVSEWGELKHLFLPCITLIIPISSVISRVTRNKYLEESKALWVRVLIAKGMSNVQIQFRILKICLPTILNVVAIQLSVLLAGTLITENIFDIPGLGGLLLEGIQNRDYPVVQGVILYSSLIYMFVYFSFDYLNGYLDPRIQNEK